MLSASIFKNVGRSFSNGGISAGHDEVLIVNAEGPWDDDFRPEIPRVRIERNAGDTLRAVPVQPVPGGGYEVDGEGVGPMFGGCYIATSDSRFSDLLTGLLGRRFYGAVPLHDRFESQELYDAMSK